MKYEDIEQEFEKVLAPLSQLRPSGTEIKARICKADNFRKARSNGDAKHLSSKHCVILTFEPIASSQSMPEFKKISSSPAVNLTQLLIEALDRLEHSRDKDYVVLKWFRDNHCPSLPAVQQVKSESVVEVLNQLIEKGLILVEKVPHPKDPQVTVSTLVLNRSHPEVRVVLGSGAVYEVTPPTRTLRRISGPPLSQTIIEGRR